MKANCRAWLIKCILNGREEARSYVWKATSYFLIPRLISMQSSSSATAYVTRINTFRWYGRRVHAWDTRYEEGKEGNRDYTKGGENFSSFPSCVKNSHTYAHKIHNTYADANEPLLEIGQLIPRYNRRICSRCETRNVLALCEKRKVDFDFDSSKWTRKLCVRKIRILCYIYNIRYLV